MRKYQKRLAIVEESDPKRKDDLDRKYGRGWFLGSSKAKKELVKELEKSGPDVDWDGVDLKELNESRWEGIVCEELKERKISEAMIISSDKGADWKIEIAKRLRKEMTAKNPWIAKRLAIGHPNYVSNLVNG